MLIDYSAPNYSRSCEIDVESAWIGLANVKFRKLGKRVKQDAPDRNPAKKHPDNLSFRLSRVKWSCWLKRVLGDEVDQCLYQAWGSDEEWDGVDA